MSRDILLLEPGYRNKYPPLGLMKIAAYHRERGDQVRFHKHGFGKIEKRDWDRVYVTTLFSFEWKRTAKAIDWSIDQVDGDGSKVFVGGIAASLMHERYLEVPEWTGVRFIKGLLDRSPAESLRLTDHDGPEAAEVARKAIEDYPPYYGWLLEEERKESYPYHYPVEDAYFGYASRGCVRKCKFCGVPTLEGDQKVLSNMRGWVEAIKRSSGAKRDLILMDNNVTAAPNYKEIMAEVRDLGFRRGAMQENPKTGKLRQRRVDFNQGVDARILVKSPMYMREMGSIAIRPLRIAFDHIGMRKVYRKAVEMAADEGIEEISNYMLYNFRDSPEDLYERMRVNREVNEERRIKVWSFPMRYQPVTHIDRSHVGPRWTWYELRAFQIMLQVTHGAVSGTAGYFEIAYGANADEFKELLVRPLAFIWHRKHYTEGEGRATREEFERQWTRMSTNDKNELMEIIGSGGGSAGLRKACKQALESKGTSWRVREVLPCYAMETRGERNSEIDREIAEKLREGIAIEDAGIDPEEESSLRETRGALCLC